MVELIEIDEAELLPTTARRAIVLEDKIGVHDHERMVIQDMRGRIWSSSSIQANRQSTISMAMRWAAGENLGAVYLVR